MWHQKDYIHFQSYARTVFVFCTVDNINLVRLLQLFCNLPNILGSTLGTSLLPFYVARFKYHHVLHEARGCEDFKQLTRVRESCKISKITVFAISVILQDNKPNEVLSQVSEVKKGKFCWRQL